MSKSRKKKDAAVGKQFKVGRFTVVVDDVLNEGGFAVIFLVHDDKGNRWAMKRIRLNNFRDFLQVRFEAETMRVMSQASNNVVRYVDDNLQEVSAAFRRSGTPHDSDKTYEVFILTEYYPRNVLQLINERLQDRRMLRESEVLQIFCDVCAAVGQMHARQPPIIHRDLKIENILISATGRYILCDFGSATNRVLDPASDDINMIREELERYTTIAYRAPEMVNLYNMKTISTKADIWALGVLLYKLCFFNDPFGNSHLAIENAKYFIPAQHHYRTQVITLLRLCLNPDPALRPDVYQLAEAACEMSQRRCTVPNINNYPTLDLSSVAGTSATSVTASTDLSASPSAATRELHADHQPKPSGSGTAQNSAIALTPRGGATAPQPVESTTSVAPRERPRAAGRSGKTPTFTLPAFGGTASTAAVHASGSPSSSLTAVSGSANTVAESHMPSVPSSAHDAVVPVHEGLSAANDSLDVADDNTIIQTEFEPEKDLLQLSDPNTASSASSVASLSGGGGGGFSSANNATLTAEFESYFSNSSYPDPFSSDEHGSVPVPLAKLDDEDEVNLISISSSPPPPLTPSIQRHIEQQYQFHLPSPSTASASSSLNVFAPSSLAATNSSANAAVVTSVSENVFTIPVLPHQHRNSLSLKKKPYTAAAIRARAVTAQQPDSFAPPLPLVQVATVRPPPQAVPGSDNRVMSPTQLARQPLNSTPELNDAQRKLPSSSSRDLQQKGALNYERLDHDDDFSDDEPPAKQRTVLDGGQAPGSASSLSSSASQLTAASGPSQQRPPVALGGFLRQNGMAFERSITTKKLSVRNSVSTNNSFSEDGGEKYTPSSPEVSSSSSSSSSSSTGNSVRSSNSGSSDSDADGSKTKSGRKNRKPKQRSSNIDAVAQSSSKSKLSGAISASTATDADHNRTISGRQQLIARIDPPPSSSNLRRTHLQHLTASSGGQHLSPSLASHSSSADVPASRFAVSSSSSEAVRYQNSSAATATSSGSFHNMPTKTTFNDPFSNAPGFATVFDRRGINSVPLAAVGGQQRTAVLPPRIASVLDQSPSSNVGGSRSSHHASSIAARATSCNPFADSSVTIDSGGNSVPHYVHSTPLVIRRSAQSTEQCSVPSSSKLSAAANPIESLCNVGGPFDSKPKTPSGISLIAASSDVLNNSNNILKQHNSPSAAVAVRAHKRGDSAGSVGMTSSNNKFAVAAVAGSERLSPR